MGLFFNRSSNGDRLQNNPVAQMMVKGIERYGVYDGSASSKVEAQRVFDMQAHYAGCSNPRTETLYWETLKESGLPMPLAAAYAFAIGEYLDNPTYNPIASGGDTPNAKMAAHTIGAVFPSYRHFVEGRHVGNDTRYILALSANIIEVYL